LARSANKNRSSGIGFFVWEVEVLGSFSEFNFFNMTEQENGQTTKTNRNSLRAWTSTRGLEAGMYDTVQSQAPDQLSKEQE